MGAFLPALKRSAIVPSKRTSTPLHKPIDAFCGNRFCYAFLEADRLVAAELGTDMDCGNCFMTNCMDSYCQSPWPDLGAVDGVVDDRAHPLPMDFVQSRQERQPHMPGKQHVRQSSSSSCTSSRSLMSSDTASSTKSHRRRFPSPGRSANLGS